MPPSPIPSSQSRDLYRHRRKGVPFAEPPSDTRGSGVVCGAGAETKACLPGWRPSTWKFLLCERSRPVPLARLGPAMRKPRLPRLGVPRPLSCCELYGAVEPFTSDHAKFAHYQRGKALNGAPDAADVRLTCPTLVSRDGCCLAKHQTGTRRGGPRRCGSCIFCLLFMARRMANSDESEQRPISRNPGTLGRPASTKTRVRVQISAGRYAT
jgi:hypothetical protein